MSAATQDVAPPEGTPDAVSDRVTTPVAAVARPAEGIAPLLHAGRRTAVRKIAKAKRIALQLSTARANATCG
jgi:hypothetical protein